MNKLKNAQLSLTLPCKFTPSVTNPRYLRPKTLTVPSKPCGGCSDRLYVLIILIVLIEGSMNLLPSKIFTFR